MEQITIDSTPSAIEFDIINSGENISSRRNLDTVSRIKLDIDFSTDSFVKNITNRDEKLGLETASRSSEDIMSSFDFTNRGFVSSEAWVNVEIFNSKVLEVNKEKVTCECLVDQENLLFQTRVFSREMFLHIKKISASMLVQIVVKSKPGSSRIDIIDGKGIVDKRLFELNHLWDGLKDSNLGKPIDFSND
jgi:hypothetical protein